MNESQRCQIKWGKMDTVDSVLNYPIYLKGTVKKT